MKISSNSTNLKYSFSNANMVYNEDGIQVHREEQKTTKQHVTSGTYPVLKIKETSR